MFDLHIIMEPNMNGRAPEFETKQSSLIPHVCDTKRILELEDDDGLGDVATVRHNDRIRKPLVDKFNEIAKEHPEWKAPEIVCGKFVLKVLGFWMD
jgi:hypothetical protein